MSLWKVNQSERTIRVQPKLSRDTELSQSHWPAPSGTRRVHLARRESTRATPTRGRRLAPGGCDSGSASGGGAHPVEFRCGCEWTRHRVRLAPLTRTYPGATRTSDSHLPGCDSHL